MFKTEEQIEEMAKEYADSFSSRKFQPYNNALVDYFNGATQMQKDLLESASKDKQEAWLNYRKGEGHSFGHKEALDYGWQACALFHKAKIDTLKQRELEYQSDLRQKDAEIDRLKKKISSFDAYASADEKYQEAVKDIDTLSKVAFSYAEKDKFFPHNKAMILERRTKYGLDKKEW